jgi:hypothetical protein
MELVIWLFNDAVSSLAHAASRGGLAGDRGMLGRCLVQSRVVSEPHRWLLTLFA